VLQFHGVDIVFGTDHHLFHHNCFWLSCWM